MIIKTLTPAEQLRINAPSLSEYCKGVLSSLLICGRLFVAGPRTVAISGKDSHCHGETCVLLT